MPSLVVRVSMNQTYVPNPYSSALRAIRSAGGRTRGPAMPAVVARVSTNTCTSATTPNMASCTKLDSAVSWCRSAALCSHTAKLGQQKPHSLQQWFAGCFLAGVLGCPVGIALRQDTACTAARLVPDAAGSNCGILLMLFCLMQHNCYTARKLGADNVRVLRRPLLLLTHCLN